MMVAVAAGLVATMNILPAAAQSTPSASRSFDSASVDPGGQVVVTIAASDYGAAGGVTETLPAGFSYVNSSLGDSQVMELADNKVRFTLQGDTSFTYTVTASDTPGSYTFSGTLRDIDRTDHPVGGADRVTVNTPPAGSTPSASRSFDSASVDPGGQVVVTIAASDYGAAGGVTETLPAGFSYVNSSLDDSQVSELVDNKVRFTLQGDTSFTYTVTASDTPGSYTFSGTLRDADRADHTVGGADRVTVNTPPAGPTPSASRSFDSASVDRGGQVVVTITASNYGQAGGVTETLPADFSYVNSSLDDSQVLELADNKVRFTLQGDTSFTYTVTAPTTTGSYDFSGELRDSDKNDTRIGGASRVTVRKPSTTVPTAVPTAAPTAVSTAVPTAVPTAVGASRSARQPATPTPTATPKPTPVPAVRSVATPVPTPTPTTPTSELPATGDSSPTLVFPLVVLGALLAAAGGTLLFVTRTLWRKGPNADRGGGSPG